MDSMTYMGLKVCCRSRRLQKSSPNGRDVTKRAIIDIDFILVLLLRNYDMLTSIVAKLVTSQRLASSFQWQFQVQFQFSNSVEI